MIVIPAVALAGPNGAVPYLSLSSLDLVVPTRTGAKHRVRNVTVSLEELDDPLSDTFIDNLQELAR